LFTGPEEEEEQVDHKQDALEDQELLNRDELWYFCLSLENHEEEHCHAHLGEEVFAELA